MSTLTVPPASPAPPLRARPRWWRPAVIVAAALLILAGGITLTPAEAAPPQANSFSIGAVSSIAATAVGEAIEVAAARQVVEETIVQDCVIRFYVSGPAIHANGSHVCDLATAVSVTSTGRLRLTGVSTLPVGSIQVTPDECLVQLGVDAGPSGGSGDIEFQVTKDGNPIWATNDYLTNNGSESCNFWFMGSHKVLVAQ